MISQIDSLHFTTAAVERVKLLLKKEKNLDLKLRVYITGGGCSGFQYGFTFDRKINQEDIKIEKQGVILLVDPLSFQYLAGGSVDYQEGLLGANFTIINPNAKSTCSCGSSFNI